MNRLYFAISFALVFFLGGASMNAQEQKPEDGKKVFKTSIQKIPTGVQKTMKQYSSRKFDSKVTYTREKNGNLYKLRILNDQFIDYLLIDENGKVKGIEYGEAKERS